MRETAEDSYSGLQKLQLRFMAPIAGFVFLLLAVSGLIFVSKSRQAIVEKVRDEQLGLAQAGAHGVGAYIGVVSGEMDRIVRRSAIRSGQTAQSLLKAEAGATTVFSGFHLFGKSGNLIASSGIATSRAALVREDQCFEKVLSGSVFCLGAVRDVDTDHQFAFAMSPVVSDLGEIRSVFVAEAKVGAGAVGNIVSGIQAGRKGFAFLVDGEGELVWTGDERNEARVTNYSAIQPVREAREGRRGSVDYRYGNTLTTASFYPVPSTDWVFVVQRPAREASGGVGYLLPLLFTALGTLGSVGVAVALSQTFSRFVFSLAGRMDAVARGDLQQRIEEDEHKDLAPIARAFNHMLESVRAGRTDREDSYRELLGTARFHQSMLDSIRDFFVVVDSGMRVLHLSESAREFCQPSRAAVGEQMQALGASWSQQRFVEAVRQVIIDGGEREIDNMAFTRGDGGAATGEAALFKLHIHPMAASDSGRREGALISGMEITKEAKQFKEQKHSGRFYRALTEDSPVAILLVDEEMKVEWWNPAASELLGLKPDSAGAAFAESLAHGGRNLFIENFKRVMNDGAALPAWEMELPGAGKPALLETQMARVTISGGRARIAMYMRKMPHRRLLEKEAYEGRPALEKKLQYFRGMIEGIGAPVAVVDKRGAMVAVNNHFEGLTRNTRQMLMGQSFAEQFRNGPACLSPEAVADSGASAEGEAQFGSGAEELQVLIHAEPLRVGDDGVEGVVYLVREVGNARMEQEQRFYQARSSAVKDTSRHIVDRIEPSVASLQESLQELGQNIFSAENRRTWRKAAASLRLIMNSLNNLRLFTSEPKPKYETCRLGELLEEVILAAGEVNMIPPGVSIEREYDEELPEVRADAEQMKMVVWQLLMNAFHAIGDEGEILVRAVARDIAGAPSVLVEVWNGGEKVDEKEIARVFDPFRGDTRGGMGLGLSLCRRVVQSHGGRIGLEREDEFTRVSFYLPAGSN